MRGEEAPTPGMIELIQKIVENVIEKKKKKRLGKAHLIQGMKSKEEIEKILVDFLVVRKNQRSKLICENYEVQVILEDVAVKLT